MELTGKIKRVLFTNNSSFSIVLVEELDDTLLFDNGFMFGVTECVFAGVITSPSVGGIITAKGDFVDNSKYGRQFKVTSSEIELVGTFAILGYLKSGFIKGVGEKTAELIVAKFGNDTIDVIENHPERLAEVKYISAKKAKEIHKSYNDSRMYINIVKEFGGDITENQTQKIYKRYAEEAINVIRKNPYQLIYDIRGFGFLTVDKMAKKLGVKPNDIRRIKAAVLYTMENYSLEGNCYMDINYISYNVKSLFTDIEVTDETIADAVSTLINEEYLIYESGNIYLKDIFDAEKGVAGFIAEILNEKPKKKAVDKAIEKVERELCIEYEQMQKDAISMAVNNNISVITGGPGTGKSTIIYAIMKAYGENNVILCAPTGKAAQRMAEVTKHEAVTVHIIINRNLSDLDKALVIMDEATMCDIELAFEFFKNIKAHIRHPQFLFVGDIDQLPSIGAGNFFRDLVDSIHVPTTRLKYSHRFGGTIADNATRINHGDSTIKCDENFIYNQIVDKEEKQKVLLEKYFEEIKTKPLSEVIILSPMKKGPTGTNELNKIISNTLNPRTSANKLFDNTNLRVGDRVIQTTNNYTLEVFNGDTGKITSYDPTLGLVGVFFDKGKIVYYDKLAINELALAFAITIHKSQGSEYNTVLIPCGMENYIMLQRNLLYTAVTRAKKKVVLFSDPKTVSMTVRNVKAINRATRLRERIGKLM